ncbi:MAG TPA: cupin domain-containing protein [Candidatus Polarisedimenticolia bacterium]
MEHALYDIADLTEKRRSSGEEYLEFLKVPALNAGVYELAAGTKDSQTPHDEDEVYYVLAGRARLRVGASSTPLRPGSVIYVKADVEHRFEAIEEDLRLLVFFSSLKA